MELRTRIAVLGVVGLLAVGVGACEHPESPPVQPPLGAVRLALQTPRTDDGAVVLTVQGPDVSGLQPASPAYLVYSRPTSTGTVRVIVIGDLKAGPLATLSIGPGHQLSDYSVTVDQVAGRTDTLRTDLSGYQVRVTVQ